MSKENEIPESEIPEELDYSDQDETEFFDNTETEPAKAESTVTQSGRRKVIGIPADIEDTLNIQKGDQVSFIAKPDPKNPEKDNLVIVYDKFNANRKTETDS